MTARPAETIGAQRRRDPQSVLRLVDRILADKDRTANAKELLAGVSSALTRVLVSAGVVLYLASLVVHSAGLPWVLGGAVASAVGVRWRVQRRRSRRRPGKSGTSPSAPHPARGKQNQPRTSSPGDR
ncbi:Flp pilus assembly protein TadB [Amycolatopsis umgeniensis]|uniref:Flp pilus assembly protein TadB n=1 Tax=Amycolatopsis umgeniensis TaxID=336628 RepID=A0A841BAX5_9PSEU|nr:Flp pilus assembly protein TadB [Amycolatopsis umgeniensis]